MKIKLIFSVLFLSLVLTTTAGNKKGQTQVKGVVYENTNGDKQPLTLAYVYIDNTEYCTYTDAKGNFELEIPSGKHKVKVSFMGYESETKVINTRKDNTSEAIRFILTEKNETITQK